jgi:D-alanyl-D-alanine carboxypeptidase/D-alanyl-D-alanine-endopeptidase (penicillin-binding protein 4)
VRWLAASVAALGLTLTLVVVARSQEAEPADPGAVEDDDAVDSATAYPAPPPGVDPAKWLSERVEALILTHPELAGARVGVTVTDLARDKVLVARQADAAFSIASTAKLATTAAALTLLGGAHRYETGLFADEKPTDDDPEVIHGDLVLRGGGDPELSTSDLDDLVVQLRRRGVQRIEGGLVIDASLFDDDHVPPAFDDKRDDAAFRAPICAASLDQNAVGLWIVPGRSDGAPVHVELSAGGDSIALDNQALTTDQGRTSLRLKTKVLEGKPPRLELTLTGTLRRDAAPAFMHKRIDAPEYFIGATLRARLAAHGIKVGRQRLTLGPTPARARLLAMHVSAPLAVILRDLGKRSDNFVAEMILRGLGVTEGGPPASSAAAVARVHQTLVRFGWPEGSYRLDNGSGLYDATSVSPHQLLTLLAAVWRTFAIAPDFVAQLSQAGADGTLARRFPDGPAHDMIRAKTGTLDDVIALAGYAGRSSGPPLAFVVLLNDVPRGQKRAARALVDEIAQSVAATAQVP